ncbi:MAG: hypothetical protein SF028_12230 [Candidatus Sumerlaeia bacterium]|nr:hypothetical protein [Candidatus Sumerlaeia bacterium]
MEFPAHLWDDPADRELARGAADLFADAPLVLTDRLANSVFLSPAAERLLGDRAPALVNRACYSLLGFDSGERPPDALATALLGEREPWKAMVLLAGRGCHVEASAIRRGARLVCGVLRLTPRTDGGR